MNLNFPNCLKCNRLMDDIYVEEDGEKIGRGSIGKFVTVTLANIYDPKEESKEVYVWYCQFCHAISYTEIEKIDENQTTLDQWSEEE